MTPGAATLVSICASFVSGLAPCASAQSALQPVPLFGDTMLRLDIRVKAERYCEGDVDVGSLQLRSVLRFVNSGKRPLILYKGAGYTIETRAARTVAGLQGTKPEYHCLVDVDFTGRTKLESAQPGPDFIVLQPQSDYAGVDVLGLVVGAGTGAPAGTLGPGSYYVQVTVGTSPPTPQSELATASQRWESWGYLWTQDIKSEPFLVKIDAKPKWRDCAPDSKWGLRGAR
jgi:hypothetical protein